MTMLADHRPDVALAERETQELLALILVERRSSAGRVEWWAAAIAAGTASAGVYLLARPAQSPNDFITYRGAAALAAHGVDVYAAPLPAGLPFTYPPVATVVLWPSTLLPTAWAYATWTVVTLIVLAAVLAAVTPLRGVLALTAVLVAADATGLLRSHLREGQVSLVLMGLCLADAVRSDSSRLGRAVPRGLLVGVAAAIKLTPALFTVYFVISRQWRLAAFSIVGCCGATLVGALSRPGMTATFFGHSLWSLRDRVDLDHPVGDAGNQSVHGLAAAAGLDGGAAPALLGVLTAAGVLVAARHVHRHGRESDAWLVVGLGAPTVTPFAWNHHHVFVLPAVVVLVARCWPRRPTACLVALAATLGLLRYVPGTGDRLLHAHEWWTAALGAMIREGTLLVAIGCIVALTWTARTARTAHAAEVAAR